MGMYRRYLVSLCVKTEHLYIFLYLRVESAVQKRYDIEKKVINPTNNEILKFVCFLTYMYMYLWIDARLEYQENVTK